MNVVLIALDSLRADHLGCYGYDRNTSPFIDSLAKSGVVYDACIAPNVPTHPSFTTMFSGRDAIAHNIVNIGRDARIADGVRLLPEILREQGFVTAAVDNLERHFVRGFDRYEKYAWDLSDPAGLRKAEAVTDTAMPVIDDLLHQSEPFFLFVHYWDPHTPYLPPAPHRTQFYEPGRDPYDLANTSMNEAWSWDPFKWYFHEWIPGVTDADYVVNLYDGEIAYMDSQLDRLFRALAPKRDETLMIVLADHGEVLNDQLGYFDHHGLYDAVVRIPLIVHWPGKVPAGRRVPGMVQNLDIAPTILDLAGIADRKDMEGLSLVPTMVGLRESNYDEVFLSEATWELKRGVRTQRWKFIDSIEPDPHGRPMQELFDLEADPDEQSNVTGHYPEVVHELEERLQAWVSGRLRAQGRDVDPVREQGTSATRIGTPVPGVTPGAGATPSQVWTSASAGAIPKPE